MGTSSSPVAKSPTLTTSSPDGLQRLLDNDIEEGDRQEQLQETWLQIRMANNLRLAQDNQRLLDTTAAEDRALRQQRHRLREFKLRQMGVPGDTSLEYPPEEAMGDINVNSPETHNHYHPQPVKREAPWLKAALGVTTLAAAVLGGGLAATALQRPQSASPVNTTVESRDGFLIEFPDGKKPN